MRIHTCLLVAAAVAIGAQSGSAADAYFHTPLSGITFTEGALPSSFNLAHFNWRMLSVMEPYVILDGEGEGYVGGESIQPWSNPGELYRNGTLGVRAPAGKEVAGRLFVPKADFSGMVALKFKLAASAATLQSQAEFFKIKESHYQHLREREIPGGAWFRHQEAEAANAHGAKAAAMPGNNWRNNRRRGRGLDDSYDSTYDLFSGGRGLSENLQLDRVLPVGASGEATVEITNLAGISVREMDWKTLIKDAKPKADPLAAFIPFDQHALFFPSFQALTTWLDQADSDGTPVLQIFEPRSEDANSRGRIQKQLCLELNDLSRLLGPTVIGSAACTGSDPYLRTGTDLAVLYETKSPAILLAFIQARQAASRQTNSAVSAVKGEVEGVAFAGVESPDREVSSFAATLNEVVYVSNSRYQLRRLLEVAKGKSRPLASQDEYTYFRSRYPAGENGETAFLVLSDATIRRWCGPQWRIGNARRTRVAAALAELQAAHLDELAGGTVKPGVLPCNLPEAGEVRLTPTGVISSTWGTLDFLTPIAEASLTKVTQSEADAYNRWRTGYQQNWSQFFDPIAVRFSLQPQQLSAEVTVMPLIAGTEYRRFIDISRGAKIGPDSGDRHPEALLHLAMSLNAQSEPIKESGNLLGNFSPSLKANPLGWLGQSVALYADRDVFWEELQKADKASDFLEKNYPRLPLALYCEVKNPLGLTAFLSSLRAFVEQTAPKMTTWQNLEYQGQPYVKVTSPDSGDSGMPTNFCIFYAATPRSLTVTLSEPLLKRALDRQAGPRPSSAVDQAHAARAWLGTNLCLQVAHDFVPAIDAMFHEEYETAQQSLAWNNLPILNEWKRRYPTHDPVKLHEQFWQTRLRCPGDGTYVWNEDWQTMESTVYGHPGQPKAGPKVIRPLARVSAANLGITFENDGLSARVVLQREPANSR